MTFEELFAIEQFDPVFEERLPIALHIQLQATGTQLPEGARRYNANEMRRSSAATMAFLVLSACGARKDPVTLQTLIEEFTSETLSFSPVTATAAGYHDHKGLLLDEILDNYSEEALSRQRDYYRDFRGRLNDSVRRDELAPDDRADFDVLAAAIDAAEAELDFVQDYKTNALRYVELIGQALFTPFVLEYAPIETRYEHIIRRMRRVPALLGQARQNLTGASAVNREAALRANDAVMESLASSYRGNAPVTQKREYDRALPEARSAMEEFGGFLRSNFSGRTVDARLGPERYRLKFRTVLGLEEKPEAVLAEAERELGEIRQRMQALGAEVCRNTPCRAAGAGPDAQIRAALDAVAQRHATPGTYFADARRDLDEARGFVRAKDLLTLPARDNLQVIETPEFMRGVYAVGGFMAAPPLQPELGAFYWLTPIPTAWEPARIESKLREYNHYGLKILTIHEAMPGHYVQFEHANNVEPRYRRLLRVVFGNGVYIEGWAVYATEVMIEEGYLDGSPELALTFWKQQLRVVSNAILDIRYHMMDLSDAEAMSLMIGKTFQEKEEAEAKLQRLKLTSAQLPSYYAGWRAWRQLRAKVESTHGASFRLKDFHDRALAAGPVPMPVLERLLVN